MSQIDILTTSTELQSDFIKGLSRQSDLDVILDRMVEKTATVLAASACTIFTIDTDLKTATQRAGSGYHKEFNWKHDVRVIPADQVNPVPEKDEDRLGLTGWILSTGKPLLARSPEEVVNHPHHTGRLQLMGDNLRLQTFLGVPIRDFYGEVIGLIKAERQLCDNESQSIAKPFSEHDEVALETIARAASRCITYVKIASTSERKKADAITAWSRDVISEAAGTEGELDSFLNIIVDVTSAATRADSCGIFLRDEGGKTLTQRAGKGSQALRKRIRSYPWPDQKIMLQCSDIGNCHPPTCSRLPNGADKAGLTAWIAATGRSFRAANWEELSKHCHHKGQFDAINFDLAREECGAFLGVPLQVGGSVIGVAKVENTESKNSFKNREFTIEDQQRLEVLADDIALAILRFQQQTQDRYRIIHEAEKTILEILRGGLDIEDLSKKVVLETKELFKAGACALFLREGNYLRQHSWAASGYAKQGTTREYELVSPEEIKDAPRPHEKKGLTVWIAVKQEKFTARSNTELTMHPHHKGTYDDKNFPQGQLQRCESFMGFPMLIKEGDRTELVGVLKLESKMRRVGAVEEYTYFNELDERVFELIANSAALAIQNARLAKSRREADRELAENEARVVAWQEFSSEAAHNVGNDVVAIRGALRFLGKDIDLSDGNENLEKYFTMITGALDRMKLFIDKVTRDPVPRQLRRERLNVNKLCESVLSNIAAPANVEVHKVFARDLPDIWGDKARLGNDFREIVHNAIKAMAEAGGRLEVKTTINGNWIQIEFIDTGKGVPPELKEKIFERGFHASESGTGHGLGIAKKTVLEHRGELFETGTFGESGHFVIRLPIDLIDATSEAILVVEDREEQRHLIQRTVLEGAPNRKVLTAANCSDAKELLDKHSFDAVIADIALNTDFNQDVTGLEVVKLAVGKNVPVIVVSANLKKKLPGGEVLVEEEVRRLGCYAAIPRTLDQFFDVVQDTLNQALEERRSINVRSVSSR